MSNLFTNIDDVNIQILLALTHRDLYTMYHTSRNAKHLIDTHQILLDRLNSYQQLLNEYYEFLKHHVHPATGRKLTYEEPTYRFIKQMIENKLKSY